MSTPYSEWVARGVRSLLDSMPIRGQAWGEIEETIPALSSWIVFRAVASPTVWIVRYAHKFCNVIAVDVYLFKEPSEGCEIFQVCTFDSGKSAREWLRETFR